MGINYYYKAFVLFLAGSLPGNALLQLHSLSLFSIFLVYLVTPYIQGQYML